MVSVFDRPGNAGVLRHLGHGRDPDEAGFGPPPPDVDRWHLGAHPDVVERLWDSLNGSLPADARWLVFDGPALVHLTAARGAIIPGRCHHPRTRSSDEADQPRPDPQRGTHLSWRRG